jgi:hypothetical protein
MELYNKMEILGEIVHFESKKSQKGNDYVKGLIASYKMNDKGKKQFYFSQGFMAFEDVAAKLDVANIKKGDTVLLIGNMSQSLYNDKTYVNLIVTEVNLNPSHQKEETQSSNEFYDKPKPKQKTKKEVTKQEISVDDEDFPF